MNRRTGGSSSSGGLFGTDTYDRTLRDRFWLFLFIIFVLAICAIAIASVGLERSDDAKEESKLRVQIIESAFDVIDEGTNYLIMKRKDWEEGNYVQKCGIFDLKKGSEGQKLTIYNDFKQCNVFVQPHYDRGQKQFWHITMRDLNLAVELIWSGESIGWSIVNKEGHFHVHSLKEQLDRYMYVLHTVRGLPDIPDGLRDFVTTIDLRPDSLEYGGVVHIALGFRNATWEYANEADRTEYHHGHLFEDMGHIWLVAPSLSFTNPSVDFYDLAHDKKAPALSSYIFPGKVKEVLGIGALHTVHEDLQTGNLLISFLGSPPDPRFSPGGIASFSPNLATHVDNSGDEFKQEIYLSFPVFGLNSLGQRADNYGYDFALEQDCLNIMVTTSWGPPDSFDFGFDPSKPYGATINVWKLVNERSDHTRPPGDPNAVLIKTFALQAVPGMGGPTNGQGIVPLEVRRSKIPGVQYYTIGVTLPGSVVLVYCDHVYGNPTDCNDPSDWHMKTTISPSQLVADGLNTVHVTNQGGNLPVWTNPFGFGDFGVPLVTDLALSEGNKVMYVSLWLMGVLLQYDISDMKNPVLIGGIANLGGVTTIAPGTNVFNPDSYEFDTGKIWAGGPQMIKVDPSGKFVYVTNSLFSRWDIQFFPPGLGSIETNGGMLIKIITGVENERVEPPGTQKPMKIDTSFGKNGVISFSGLTHPEVSGPFKARAHEMHTENSNH